MTVAAALESLQNVGTVQVSHGNIKLRFPEEKRAQLQPAIDVLRNGKAEAMALLNAQRSQEPRVADPELRGGGLKGHAVELWRREERFFIVADEKDAALAVSRLGASVGEVWTGTEIEIVARIEDQAFRDEVQRFKREFNGRVRQARTTNRRGPAR